MVVKCVQSVLASEGADVEVIVVDDCSSDDTMDRIEERFGNDPRVKCVRTPENRLTSGARNFGAGYARGDYLLFLDNDNEIAQGAIAFLVEYIAANPGVKLVAPISAHCRQDGSHLIWTLGCGYNPWTSMVREFYPHTRLEDLQSDAMMPELYPTAYAPNAFMVRRADFLSAGGFDEGYGMQYEEADFGLRVTANNPNLGMICAKAVTRHHGYLDPAEVGELRALGVGNVRRAYCFGRNRVKFARRHFAWYQALVVALVFAPLSAVWYGKVALKNRRPDIAWAYLKGTIAGIFGLYGTKLYGGGQWRKVNS